MESIGILILVVIGWALFKVFLSAGTRTIGAVAKAAVGKGTIKDNLELAFKGMGQLEIRFKNTHYGEDGGGPLVKEIEGKGLFPLMQTTRVGFITSVFDKTTGELEPVLSAIDHFQEPHSPVYQHQVEIGQASPDQGFVSWVRLGVVIPEIIQPPYGGTRNLQVVIALVDLDDLPDITHGFREGDQPGLLWQQSLVFSHSFEEKGYKEAAEHRDEAVALALKIGMAVAMSDGSLDDEEGETLKEWIIRSIDPFPDEKRERLKALYNSAMEEAYLEAKSGDLSLSVLTNRMNEIGEKTTKYETIELCFEVMAADGIADAEEIKMIRKVSEALSLDLDEINKMRDQKIISLDSRLSDHVSVEDLLGIENGWDNVRIKKHIRTEFQKWNDRLNTLAEGDERDNAQRMLTILAEAREKYA